jgi:hypothetical protein
MVITITDFFLSKNAYIAENIWWFHTLLLYLHHKRRENSSLVTQKPKIRRYDKDISLFIDDADGGGTDGMLAVETEKCH